MKNLKFAEALNNEVENVVENTKVSAAFVQELKDPSLIWRGSGNQVIHYLR